MGEYPRHIQPSMRTLSLHKKWIPAGVYPVLCYGTGMTILFITVLLWASFSYSATLKLKDEVGREVTFSFPPKRIVSLAPNITEILFSLGLDEEVVGVSIHCNYPEKAKGRVRAGSYIRIDFEMITFLKPDLVIATGAGNTREVVDRVEKLGFPTYVIFPKNFTDILK